ncbi:MAG: hypothetical protein QM742_14550 [Aquabacterium sp.]
MPWIDPRMPPSSCVPRGWRPPQQRWRRFGAAAMVLLWCTACAPLQPKPPAEPVPPPPPPPPTTVYVPMLAPEDLAARQLLSYQAALSKMPPADWPKEAGRLGDGSASLEDTMKLALVLAYTHNSGDLARALQLLDKVLTNPSVEAQAWQGVARMLQGLIAEQRRNEEQIERLNQQLRDAQRDNQRKLDQLNEKLEALKSIERSLNNRFPTPGVAPIVPATPAPGPSKPGPRP